jgi:hypothetical protein
MCVFDVPVLVRASYPALRYNPTIRERQEDAMKPLTNYYVPKLWHACVANDADVGVYRKDEADASFAEMEAKIVEATVLVGNAISNSEACERDLEMKDARIAELGTSLAEANEYVAEANKYVTELKAERDTKLEPAAKWFGEVMAIMHADGGHYLAKHGAEKAALDAVTKYHELHAELERKRILRNSDQTRARCKHYAICLAEIALNGDKHAEAAFRAVMPLINKSHPSRREVKEAAMIASHGYFGMSDDPYEDAKKREPT